MNEKQEKIIKMIDKIDSNGDAGLFGFVMVEQEDAYDNIGEYIIGLFKKHPEQAELLEDVIVGVSGYTIESLIDDMEERRVYYNSL